MTTLRLREEVAVVGVVQLEGLVEVAAEEQVLAGE